MWGNVTQIQLINRGYYYGNGARNNSESEVLTMNSKKVKELESFTLFQTMKNNGVDLGIFDFISPQKLDMYYSNMYGERFLSNIYLNNTIEDVAEIINGFFTTKWNSLQAFILSKRTGLEQYSEKLTETIVDTGSVITDRENTNKVSAYNDEDFVNNDNDTEHNKTHYDDLTKTRTQYIDRFSPETLNSVILFLTNNFIYDTIFTDVNEIITLKIFSFD